MSCRLSFLVLPRSRLLDLLLDRSNWARSSPRILVKAEWAESGDLRIFWLPHEASDFRKIPDGEFATFEGLDIAIQHAQKEIRAALLMVHAYVAKYDELLRGLRNDLTVVHASRIVAFYSIDIDIEDGPF